MSFSTNSIFFILFGYKRWKPHTLWSQKSNLYRDLLTCDEKLQQWLDPKFWLCWGCAVFSLTSPVHERWPLWAGSGSSRLHLQWSWIQELKMSLLCLLPNSPRMESHCLSLTWLGSYTDSLTLELITATIVCASVCLCVCVWVCVWCCLVSPRSHIGPKAGLVPVIP